MLEIMKCGGGNNYKVPHHAKQALERQGRLPEAVEVPKEVLEECVTSLLAQHMNLNGIATEDMQQEDEQQDRDVQHSQQAYLANIEDHEMDIEEIDDLMQHMSLI